jgi:dTDP-4-amino-4,6-dideoxygalactose transaminase
MSSWQIPLTDLDYGDEELAAVQRVLQSKWLSMGPEVEQFEGEFARFLGVQHAVGVSNATAALHLAFVALGIGSGDEVIQPAINFVAAANMTVAVGARPVFADIHGFKEPTLDVKCVEQLFTERTRAVVAMHYGGSLCRMTELRQFCTDRKIALIEDACHAVGAKCHDPESTELHGAMAGTIGDVGAFSFFSNKNLATGEGGMLATDRDDIEKRVRKLRSHGMTSLTWDRHRGDASSYDVAIHGFNYRIDELHAALGRVQLAKLERNNERRRRLRAQYIRELGSLQGWAVPFADRDDEPSAHLMVAVAPSPDIRASVAQVLLDARIQTSLHYPCIADFTAFSTSGAHEVELSRRFSERALSLPIFPDMTEQQVHQVCSCIQSVV